MIPLPGGGCVPIAAFAAAFTRGFAGVGALSQDSDQLTALITQVRCATEVHARDWAEDALRQAYRLGMEAATNQPWEHSSDRTPMQSDQTPVPDLMAALRASIPRAAREAPMSTGLLRRAATKLREHAGRTTPGPWEHTDYGPPAGSYKGCGEVITMHTDRLGGEIAAPSGDCYPRSGYQPQGDMAYIALMHPPIALALATWLDAAAEVVDSNDECDGFDLDAVDGTYRGAVNTARAILREDGDAS